MIGQKTVKRGYLTMEKRLNQFLEVFFKDNEKIYFRILHDKDKNKDAKNYNCILSTIDKLLPALTEKNNEGYGIHFVVNSGGQRDENITRINAHFVESDTLSKEKQLENINKFPLEPSILIESRKSIHAYWLIENGDLDKFREIQTRLAQYFNSDNQLSNLSKTLRLPTFHHNKKDPFLVECIKYNPKLIYTQVEIEKHLPKLIRPVNNKFNVPNIIPLNSRNKVLFEATCSMISKGYEINNIN